MDFGRKKSVTISMENATTVVVEVVGIPGVYVKI